MRDCYEEEAFTRKKMGLGDRRLKLLSHNFYLKQFHPHFVPFQEGY
jgi:hypothetical protein